MPRLFARLADDAAAVQSADVSLADVAAGHRKHRAAWYAGLVGPLIVPASALASMPREERVAVGVLGDTGLDRLAPALRTAAEGLAVAHVEVAVAKRGEDPQPGLRRLLTLVAEHAPVPAYAEIPLTWGLLAALDTLAEARAGGAPVAAKFRTGGLAAELFPTPVELAAVICACRDRGLRFKLAAGLHHAVRYTDPETGFVHHGFLNVLVASVLAARGAEVAEVAEVLAATDPVRLAEPARTLSDQDRPLWDGFGAYDVAEALTDLRQLGLLDA